MLHHLHAIFEDRLQAAILPPFEAQQLAAGLFTPSAPLSATAYRLLPWHLAFRPLYLGFLVRPSLPALLFETHTAAQADV